MFSEEHLWCYGGEGGGGGVGISLKGAETHNSFQMTNCSHNVAIRERAGSQCVSLGSTLLDEYLKNKEILTRTYT
jgi:hypothetical protein